MESIPDEFKAIGGLILAEEADAFVEAEHRIICLRADPTLAPELREKSERLIDLWEREWGKIALSLVKTMLMVQTPVPALMTVWSSSRPVIDLFAMIHRKQPALMIKAVQLILSFRPELEKQSAGSTAMIIESWATAWQQMGKAAVQRMRAAEFVTEPGVVPRPETKAEPEARSAAADRHNLALRDLPMRDPPSRGPEEHVPGGVRGCMNDATVKQFLASLDEPGGFDEFIWHSTHYLSQCSRHLIWWYPDGGGKEANAELIRRYRAREIGTRPWDGTFAVGETKKWRWDERDGVWVLAIIFDMVLLLLGLGCASSKSNIALHATRLAQWVPGYCGRSGAPTRSEMAEGALLKLVQRRLAERVEGRKQVWRATAKGAEIARTQIAPLWEACGSQNSGG